jgi:hypothetical protein
VVARLKVKPAESAMESAAIAVIAEANGPPVFRVFNLKILSA